MAVRKDPIGLLDLDRGARKRLEERRALLKFLDAVGVVEDLLEVAQIEVVRSQLGPAKVCEVDAHSHCDYEPTRACSQPSANSS